MRIILGSWFTLPRLGTSSFSALMKQGVKYDKSLGFKLDSESDVAGALRTLKSALGEDIELDLRCVVCGKEACPGCSYLAICDRSRVSPACLCIDHSTGVDAFAVYQKNFVENIAS
jgi:hypothetical protein